MPEAGSAAGLCSTITHAAEQIKRLHDVAADPLKRADDAAAIIRRENGRRHEVGFGDAPVRVEIYASEETVEIFIEADSETFPEERRRFALLNIPRHLFSEATAAATRRAANPRPAPSA
jgi:hypothetical protein